MQRKGKDRKLLLKLRTTAIRTSQKEQGMFDGRYTTRVQESGKVFKRKEKHKKDYLNE